MAAENVLEAIKKLVSELEVRVRKLENYWYITLGIAGVLGLGGGYLFIAVERAKNEVLASIATARDTAVDNIKTQEKNSIEIIQSQKIDPALNALGGKDCKWSDWEKKVHQDTNSLTCEGNNKYLRGIKFKRDDANDWRNEQYQYECCGIR